MFLNMVILFFLFFSPKFSFNISIFQNFQESADLELKPTFVSL